MFILVLSGNIKLGSSGEYEIRATNKSTPELIIKIPKISNNRFVKNEIAIFVRFEIFILMNQINHFVSSNFCC